LHDNYSTLRNNAMLASLDLLTAFVLFAFVSSITPGPNNTMLLASGVNFGVRRSIPHAMGISIGFMVMVLAVGFGLGEVFKAWPPLYTILRYVGAAYLLYLAYKIATSGPMSASGNGSAKPMSFLGAAAFQWVNPKAWVMAVGAITTYTPAQGYVVNVIVIAALFALVNLPSVGIWVMFGSALRNLLQNPRWLMLFNVLMALLLVISLYPLLFVESAFS
jgi:threonine/homoserine/homoserine lactone efflux protein